MDIIEGEHCLKDSSRAAWSSWILLQIQSCGTHRLLRHQPTLCHAHRDSESQSLGQRNSSSGLLIDHKLYMTDAQMAFTMWLEDQLARWLLLTAIPRKVCLQWLYCSVIMAMYRSSSHPSTASDRVDLFNSGWFVLILFFWVCPVHSLFVCNRHTATIKDWCHTLHIVGFTNSITNVSCVLQFKILPWSNTTRDHSHRHSCLSLLDPWCRSISVPWAGVMMGINKLLYRISVFIYKYMVLVIWNLFLFPFALTFQALLAELDHNMDTRTPPTLIPGCGGEDSITLEEKSSCVFT